MSFTLLAVPSWEDDSTSLSCKSKKASKNKYRPVAMIEHAAKESVMPHANDFWSKFSAAAPVADVVQSSMESEKSKKKNKKSSKTEIAEKKIHKGDVKDIAIPKRLRNEQTNVGKQLFKPISASELKSKRVITHDERGEDNQASYQNLKLNDTKQKKKVKVDESQAIGESNQEEDIQQSSSRLELSDQESLVRTPRKDAKQKNIALQSSNGPSVAAPFQERQKNTAHLGVSKAAEKLKGARFRWINEQLYTTDGSSAQEMFEKDPELFNIYHDGFKIQVKAWPSNPVDEMINFVKKKPQHLVIADFGCGEAKLAESVKQKVHSFDLVAANDRIVACDIANVPLPAASIDIAIFSLSLMGTNFGQFLIEAHRVLRAGGILKIAEVSSRIVDLDRLISAICSIGFQFESQDQSMNNVFVMLEFVKLKVKSGSSDNVVKALSKLLKPCVYKKR